MVNAFDVLKNPPPRYFDIIFIAPPQYKGMWLQSLREIDANPEWLSSNTIIVVQINPKEQEDVFFEHLRAYDQRKYGRTLLWFFETIIEEEE